LPRSMAYTRFQSPCTASTCTEKGACAVAPPRSFSPTARLQRRLTPYGAGFVPSCS
jgi:hypothetical protein